MNRTLSGVDSVTSMSSENFGMVLVQYDYDQDIDKAYDDLKKKLDGIKSDLPDDVDTPTIIEMDINSTPSITLAVNNDSVDNLYNYVNDDIVPEIEKLASVASVDVSGGPGGLYQGGADPGKIKPVSCEHEYHHCGFKVCGLFHADRKYLRRKQGSFRDIRNIL